MALCFQNLAVALFTRGASVGIGNAGLVSEIQQRHAQEHPEQQYIQIDTTNILFICGGTFVGLEDIIAKRLGKKTIGFGPSVGDTMAQRDRELLTQATVDDVLQFGLIPELVCRLPVISALSQLGVEDLVRILTEP